MNVERAADVFIPRTRSIDEPGPSNYTSDYSPEVHHTDTIRSGVKVSGISEAGSNGDQRNFGEHSAEQNREGAREVLSDRTSLGQNLDVRV